MGCWGLYQHLIQRINRKIQEASGPAPQTSQDMKTPTFPWAGLGKHSSWARRHRGDSSRALL